MTRLQLNFTNLMSSQASEHLKLGHVLSLWETLSVELAKRHLLDQEVYVIHSFEVTVS